MANLFSRSPSSLSSFDKTKRDVALGLKRSPLFRWLYDNGEVNRLLLVPRDLRTADPSLSIELDMGQFGLAGATILLEGRSPFHVEPPNLSWAKELHSFNWVRNLHAARSERALEQAMELTEHWLNSFKKQKGLPWEPDVAARRLICWLSYSNFLLREADEKTYLNMMVSIDDHMRYLSMSGMHASKGMPRLVSLIAVVFAGLCVANQEKFAEQQVKLLCAELDRQILADGGHISRDNSVLASILLDLLPLKQCFVSRNLTPPETLVNAINRMLPMIHYMRLGDGLLSRFNGSGTTLPDTLSTAMAYDDVGNIPLERADLSGYYRLQEGNVVVLMDGGSAPPLELSQKGHAGCLSFEMSSGTCPMIVNCGSAPPAFQTMAHNARASVSHSTLTINNRSSAQFIHDDELAPSDVPSLISGPEHVEAVYETKDDQAKIVGSHDGYKKQFGLIHHRLLSLSHDGYSLTGEDWIECVAGHDVIQKGLGWPFAVHFHIHPDVEPARSSDGLSVTLTLPDSQVWKLTANDAVIHLEESTFYADFAGPCQSIQAVIRGNCVGPISIPWKLTKVIETQTPDPSKVPTWLSKNVISLEEALEEQAGEKDKEEKPSKEAQITDLVEDKEIEQPKPKKKKPGKANMKSKKPRSKKRSGLASLPTFESTGASPPPLPKKGKTTDETDKKKEDGSKSDQPKKPETD